MINFSKHQQELRDNGFSIIDDIYTPREVDEILAVLNIKNITGPNFRKTQDLFAIRQFLKEIPAIYYLIFNDQLKACIENMTGSDFFVVKSIYFDKPASSNWFVSYHQDLTISVDKKKDLENFGPWTVKQDQFAVQPPIEILENIITIRIHLDNTDEHNGALRVIPKSHLNKICRPETIDNIKQTTSTCYVNSGSIMFMKPLLLHSSGRTVNNKRRRVIHIEFSNFELPNALKWSERLEIV